MGLVNWWPLNGSLEDYIGNNDLVASGAFNTDNAGKIGKCYFASTTSTYAQSTTNIHIDGNLSLCFWFKMTALHSSLTGLVSLHSHGDTSNLGLSLSGNKVAVSIGYVDGTREYNAKLCTTATTLNTWNHAVLTFNKTLNRISMYINGVREYTTVLTKEVKFLPKKLTIGRWSVTYGDYMGTGYYNDIRLYNHELSYKEVKEIAKAKIIHYNCNRYDIQHSIGDNSGFRNHAVTNAADCPSWKEDDSGLGGGSFLFNGASKGTSGNYQYFTSKDTIRVPEDGTISYYIKSSGTENGDNKYAVGFLNSICSMNNNNVMGMIYKNGSSESYKSNNKNIKDGNWHMYTMSWKANSQVKIYCDGELLGTHTVSDTMTSLGTFKKFSVGSAWTLSYGGFSGYLDDIRVYATQLSDADIKELYNVKGSISKNGKLFINEIVESDLGKNSINKKSQLITDEIMEMDCSSMKTKNELNANWVRLFYHNSNGATVLFNNKAEFLKCNEANKISDLWALEQFRNKKDGKFELLLQYGDLTGYNRWKQSSDFTKEKISGYEAIQVSWTSQGWGGLEPDTGTNTFVDGTVNSTNWYYAIGPRKAYQGGMPGPSDVVTGSVEIWVRCDDIELFRMYKDGTCKGTEFIEI